MDTKTLKIKEKDFLSLMDEADQIYSQMQKEKESLDSYYAIQNGIDKINKLLDNDLNDIFQSYLIKQNILCKMHFLSLNIKELEYRNILLEYTKDSTKYCTITYNDEKFKFKQPSLKNALLILLNEDDPLFSLLYIFYSNKERKHNLKETILLNMFSNMYQK